MSEPNYTSNWRLLNRLKTLIKKVTFLINSDINRLRLISAFTGGGVGGASSQRLSFGEQLGLTAIVSSSSDDEDEDVNNFVACDSGSSSSSDRKLLKTKSFHVQRTMSFPEEEDIDKRAEMFIENFYRQLRYERQVSLQIRYKRDTSFGSGDSNSPSIML